MTFTLTLSQTIEFDSHSSQSESQSEFDSYSKGESKPPQLQQIDNSF